MHGSNPAPKEAVSQVRALGGKNSHISTSDRPPFQRLREQWQHQHVSGVWCLTHFLKYLGRHSGSFQCDEALGVWLLRRLPKWADATLTRTRDNAVLANLDIVIDVGGTYDPASLRFDHHQRGFFESTGWTLW